MSVIMVGVTFVLLFAVLLGAAYSGFVAVLRRAVAYSAARGHGAPLRAPS